MEKIVYPNRTVGHLLFNVTASDIALNFNPNVVAQLGASAAPDEWCFGVLRGPVHREIVKVNLTNTYYANQSGAGQIIQVERGQGGSVARAWPAGTLFFVAHTAEHLEALMQREDVRTITFSPNGSLSPLFAGEKVLQLQTDCRVRWWKAIDGTNPYWELIAGRHCEGEPFIDPGWGKRPVWMKNADECQFVSFFATDAWTANHPSMNFNGTYWFGPQDLGPTSRNCNAYGLTNPPFDWPEEFRWTHFNDDPAVMIDNRASAINGPSEVGGGYNYRRFTFLRINLDPQTTAYPEVILVQLTATYEGNGAGTKQTLLNYVCYLPASAGFPQPETEIVIPWGNLNQEYDTICELAIRCPYPVGNGASFPNLITEIDFCDQAL